jgi:uncharacterized membrane protein YeaQ/YmgE (transglycosylase-associated protein family)
MTIPAVLVALLVLAVMWTFIQVAGNLLHLVLVLFMAGVVGYVADLLVPGRLPWGWLGAVVAGLVGSWLGTVLLGPLGPRIFGIQVIPALAGAVILAVGAELAGKALVRRTES